MARDMEERCNVFIVIEDDWEVGSEFFANRIRSRERSLTDHNELSIGSSNLSIDFSPRPNVFLL